MQQTNLECAFSAPAGVGEALLDWYLAQVEYLPWSADGGRSEGWALDVEEAPLQLGFYERTGRARARELIYIFGIFRAVRSIADVRMQRREWSADEAADHWKTWTPYLDDDVARVDAEIYLWRPLAEVLAGE